MFISTPSPRVQSVPALHAVPGQGRESDAGTCRALSGHGAVVLKQDCLFNTFWGLISTLGIGLRDEL